LVLDAFAPALLLAQAIGRLGNYFNQELFGLPTDLPWGLIIDDKIAIRTYCQPEVFCVAGQHYHPTFLYEMIWNLLGVAFLLFLEHYFSDRLSRGQLFSLYLAYYGFGRIFIESIRINFSTYVLGLRINVWAAIFAVILGLLGFLYLRKRPRGTFFATHLELN
jgi:prolipoprotein diacylglyceryl transferase